MTRYLELELGSSGRFGRMLSVAHVDISLSHAHVQAQITPRVELGRR